MHKVIVLIGLRSSGKSSVGKALAEIINYKFIDTDVATAEMYFKETGEAIDFRTLHEKLGADDFRALARKTIKSYVENNANIVIATGGGTMLDNENVEYFKKCSSIVYLDADFNTILERWIKHPPKFIDQNHIETELEKYFAKRAPLYENLADITISLGDKNINDIANEIIKALQ